MKGLFTARPVDEKYEVLRQAQDDRFFIKRFHCAGPWQTRRNGVQPSLGIRFDRFRSWWRRRRRSAVVRAGRQESGGQGHRTDEGEEFQV